MAERKVVKSMQNKVASGVRSPLLTPVVTGETRDGDDVADFLKGRLSSMREKSAFLLYKAG